MARLRTAEYRLLQRPLRGTTPMLSNLPAPRSRSPFLSELSSGEPRVVLLHLQSDQATTALRLMAAESPANCRLSRLYPLDCRVGPMYPCQGTSIKMSEAKFAWLSRPKPVSPETPGILADRETRVRRATLANLGTRAHQTAQDLREEGSHMALIDDRSSRRRRSLCVPRETEHLDRKVRLAGNRLQAIGRHAHHEIALHRARAQLYAQRSQVDFRVIPILTIRRCHHLLNLKHLDRP